MPNGVVDSRIFDILNKGVIGSSCCLECLCNEYFLIAYEPITQSISYCCVNYATTQTPPPLYPPDQTIDGISYRFNDCSSNFKNDMDNLKTALGVSLYNQLIEDYGGIVEFGKIGAQSGIGVLLNYLNNEGVTSSTNIYDFFDTLFSKGGIYIKCNLDNNTDNKTFFIGNLEMYLKYAEAVGLTQSAVVP